MKARPWIWPRCHDGYLNVLTALENISISFTRMMNHTTSNLKLQAQAGPSGRWTEAEHQVFLQGLEAYGKNWRKICDSIPTRTLMQVRTHAQKYFKKLNKELDRVVITKDDVNLSLSRWSRSESEIFADLDLGNTGKSTKAVAQLTHVGHRRTRSPSVPAPDPLGRHDSGFFAKQLREFAAQDSAKHETENIIVPTMMSKQRRTGRWTPGEEQYAAALMKAFDTACLPLPEGMMLRAFLAKALQCDPMRITKKFAGNAAIGKQVYASQRTSLDLGARELLALAELRFLSESKQLPKAKLGRKASIKTELDQDILLSLLSPPNVNKNNNTGLLAGLSSSSSFSFDELVYDDMDGGKLVATPPVPAKAKMEKRNSILDAMTLLLGSDFDLDTETGYMTSSLKSPKIKAERQLFISTNEEEYPSLTPPPTDSTNQLLISPLSPLSMPFSIPAHALTSSSSSCILTSKRNSPAMISRRQSQTLEDLSMLKFMDDELFPVSGKSDELSAPDTTSFFGILMD